MLFREGVEGLGRLGGGGGAAGDSPGPGKRLDKINILLPSSIGVLRIGAPWLPPPILVSWNPKKALDLNASYRGSTVADLLFVVCLLLFILCCFLFVVCYCSLFVACRLLFIVCCLLVCLLFVCVYVCDDHA